MITSEKLTHNSEFWKGHVFSWKKTGISQKEYARRNDLKSKAFNYWCRKLGFSGKFKTLSIENKKSERHQSASHFVPLKLYTESPAPINNELSVIIAKHFEVVVKEGFSPELLAKVASILVKIHD